MEFISVHCSLSTSRAMLQKKKPKNTHLDGDKFACPDNLSFEDINYCMSLCCPGVIAAGYSLSLENLQSG